MTTKQPSIIILAETDPWKGICPNCNGALWEKRPEPDNKQHSFECDTCQLLCVWQEVQG